jgi:ribosomal protein S18 acetylase RimI-like enzyme
MDVRPALDDDRDWVARTLVERWGSTVIVTRSRECDAARLEALVAVDATGARVGLLTYRIDDEGLEVVTIDSLLPRAGVGSALLAAAIGRAKSAGANRLWLITTNDNLGAIGFYQRRGLRLVAVHPGAVDAARALKATIPLRGENGIELHDEIEFALGFVAR